MPNFFYRLLFRLCRRQMLAIAKLPHNVVEPQTRFNSDRFKHVFYDDNGLAYYIIADDHDMPVGRKVYIMDAYAKFLNAVSDADFTISLDAMLAAIRSTNSKGQMQVDVGRIGYICTQLKYRKGIVLNIDLLTDLVALYFFREDESVGFVNEDKTKEKVAFLSANKHLVEDLFYAKGLNKIFPFLNQPDTTFADLVLESAILTQAFAKTIIDEK